MEGEGEGAGDDVRLVGRYNSGVEVQDLSRGWGVSLLTRMSESLQLASSLECRDAENLAKLLNPGRPHTLFHRLLPLPSLWPSTSSELSSDSDSVSDSDSSEGDVKEVDLGGISLKAHKFFSRNRTRLFSTRFWRLDKIPRRKGSSWCLSDDCLSSLVPGIWMLPEVYVVCSGLRLMFVCPEWSKRERCVVKDYLNTDQMLDTGR